MLPLIAAIFLASLLGSLHCVGMCGAFVAIACATPGQPVGHAKLACAYHGGRLVSYTLLGALAGGLGAVANVAGTLAGLQPVAAIAAGAMMIAFGVVSLLRLSGLSLAKLPMPAFMTRSLQSGHRAAHGLPPVARAGAIGLLTTLLPCGWLYAFAIAAAGTASPWKGAVAMAVFWAGTLPALIALGAAMKRGLGAVGRKLPAVTTVVVIVAGLWTLLGRSGLDAMSLARDARSPLAPSTQPADDVPACCKH
jgi:sulfite exporter TauE/SafE